MDRFSEFPRHYPTFGERMADTWNRGLRIARRMAIAFGLSTAAAIAVGAAVTDNAFAQIAVTVFGAFAFWLPMLLVVFSVERWFSRFRRPDPSVEAMKNVTPSVRNASWDRLMAVAPADRDRLSAIRRSLDASHQSFRGSQLDPDAHDLCVLIDRRLPELIERELDSLPPDDRGRKRHIGQLVDLVEQFARHCSRKRDGDTSASIYQAEILRRRFEDRLGSDDPLA